MFFVFQICTGLCWRYRKTQVVRGNFLKTKGKRMCCVETYGKHNENNGFAWEPMEHARKSQVLRGNLWRDAVTLRDASRSANKKRTMLSSHLSITIAFFLQICTVFCLSMKTKVLRGSICNKTQGKQRFGVGTYWKLNENSGFEWEHMENNMKTQALRRNQWKTQGKHMCCVGTYGKRTENKDFA